MAIILLNVCVFERKNTVFLGYIVFIYVCTFLGYQIGLKSVFFLGLGSTFGPPPWSYFSRSTTPGDYGRGNQNI